MRSLLFVVAVLFIIGGAVTIARPKASIVSHQGYRYKTGSTEVVSEDQSVIYGAISLGFGALAAFGALSWKERQ